MILFLDCPRVPGLNHAHVVSPNQTRASADIVDQWADHARNRRQKSGLAWAERLVKQLNRREDHLELLVLVGFDPTEIDNHKLVRVLERVLATLSPTDLPSCRPRAGSSLMDAEFMQELEKCLHREATDAGISLKDGLALPEPVRSHNIMKIVLITFALIFLAAGLPRLFRPDKQKDTPPSAQPVKAAPQESSQNMLSQWTFLLGDEWKGVAANTGLKLTDEESSLLTTQGSEANSHGLLTKLFTWAMQLKKELRLPSSEPQELESSRTLRAIRNARVPGDKALPAGWITNFNDQRNGYDNELRSAAVELDGFLGDIGKLDKPEELRSTIDGTLLALIEFKKAGVFSDLIKAKSQELQPCPKGWSVPTLRDMQRLSVIKQLLSSPAFVKIAYDDDQVSRSATSWKEISMLCKKGLKLHELGSPENKLFESILK
jgi:hypothetical protein